MRPTCRFTIAPNAFGCKRWLATAVPETGQTIDAVETADELLACYAEICRLSSDL
jgi:hypothetical protein